MRRLGILVVVLTALPTVAHAFDWTPDTTRIPSDPLYMPGKGQVSSRTDYRYIDSSSDSSSSSGSKKHTETRRHLMYEHLGFGLTDRLTAQVWGHYEDRKTKDLASSGGVTRYDSRGFTNPSFGVDFRALEQTGRAVSLDVGASYTPDLLPARSASSSQAGTVASGGQSANMYVALGREMKSLTVAGEIGADFHGARDVVLLSSSSTTRYGANWDYYLGLNTQTRLSERLSINAGARYILITDVAASNSASSSTANYRYGGEVHSQVALNYHLWMNRIVASLAYERNYLADSNGVTSTGSTSTSRNEVENAYLATMRFLFF